MLKIDKLNVTFNPNTSLEKRVLNNFELTVGDGDFICILGSNGAGKSTLFNSIIGAVPYSGDIVLNESNLNGKKIYRRMKDIGIVYQDPSRGTAPHLTVFENLLLSSKKKTFLKKGFRRSFKRQVTEELSAFGLNLENNLYSKVESLSGGMRQALTLYMATLSNPSLLLLDEHTAALDPKTQEIIMDITDRLVNEKHIPTLMITHNLRSALKYGNRLIILSGGKINLDISGEEKAALTEEGLIKTYSDKFSDKTLLSGQED